MSYLGRRGSTLLASLCLSAIWLTGAKGDSVFYDPYEDPLARRDEFGLLHQSPTIYPTDLAPRHAFRLAYYFKSGTELSSDPAYVGALQVALRDHGYYCGPIDGIFSDRVSEAIIRLQKNSSSRVTGTLTLAVRRALHLP